MKTELIKTLFIKTVRLTSTHIITLLSALILCSTAWAMQNDFNTQLLNLQHTWAKTNYELSGDEQLSAYKELLKQVEQFNQQYPEKAEAWIWQGIIQSSYAGVKGGLGALSYAKSAKKSLEKALEIDDKALMGSAYTSLGTLYHKVPGWPIGFGDDDEAEKMLKKAIEINPDGIDPNYFYGEYLLDDRKYKLAAMHLNKAKDAPPRTDRPLADKYRQAEIALLLDKVNKKLARKKK